MCVNHIALPIVEKEGSALAYSYIDIDTTNADGHPNLGQRSL